MQFRILGSLEVWHEGDTVSLSGPKQSKVLAVLLLEANHTVPVRRFIDALWGEDPPATARRQVQNAVAALRRTLAAAGDDPIERIGDGYRLTTTDLDRLHFASDVAKARSQMTSGKAREARDLLSRALELWRGPALAGSTCAVIAAAAERLDEARLSAVEDLIDVEMALGLHGSVIERARRTLAIDPFRQQTARQMMLGLHRSGRSAEALQVYADLRTALADELGLDPDDRLQELHHQILCNEVPEPATPAAAPQRPLPTPAQLPAGLRAFVGRDRHLADLDTILEHDPTAVPIVVITGTAGVGKTALATHWSHQIADRFPDGQLYVNLRGFDPAGTPMRPGQAVRGFLGALALSPDQVPTDPDAQASLLRSLLSGKRTLVLLDNARDIEQVRPLLPGSPGSLVVITSRNRLPGLVALHGAHTIALDLLTDDEAHDLLAARIGKSRVAEEPGAADDIIDACARLPLALSIVAASATLHTDFPLRELADGLQTVHRGLEAFGDHDPTTDIRAVFSWSYAELTAGAGRLFRLLGLHQGVDISVPASASLAGMPVKETRSLLAELAGANLVTEHRPGRYALHDLLHAYAAELADLHDTDAHRHTAAHRVLDHYLHSAYAADRLVGPARDPIALAPAQEGSIPEQLHTYQQAMAWFDTEHRNLLAALEHAAGAGFAAHAWQLAWSLSNFLDYRGFWHDMAAAWRLGVDAARSSAKTTAYGRALRTLAYTYLQLDRHEDAHRHLEEALAVFGELEDHTNRAHTHATLGYVFDRQGRHGESLLQMQRALEDFRIEGHLDGQGKALNGIGWCHALLGNHEATLTYCGAALDLHRRTGNRHGEAGALDSLGYAHHHLGHTRHTIDYYRLALDIQRELGNRKMEALVLDHLGDAFDAAGEHGAAQNTWRQAWAILHDLQHPDAHRVQAKFESRIVAQGSDLTSDQG